MRQNQRAATAAAEVRDLSQTSSSVTVANTTKSSSEVKRDHNSKTWQRKHFGFLLTHWIKENFKNLSLFFFFLSYYHYLRLQKQERRYFPLQVNERKQSSQKDEARMRSVSEINEGYPMPFTPQFCKVYRVHSGASNPLPRSVL